MATVMRQVCDICASEDKHVDAQGDPLVAGIGPLSIEADVCVQHRSNITDRLAKFIAVLRPLPQPVTVKPTAAKQRKKKVGFVHAKDRECPKCHLKFAATGIAMHERSCLGPMPADGYPCGEAGCDKKFTIPSQLVRHRNQAHGIASGLEFRCEECGREYMYEHRLKAHQAMDHGMEFAS